MLMYFVASIGAASDGGTATIQERNWDVNKIQAKAALARLTLS